jgi:CO dehydrogenase maturation factor
VRGILGEILSEERQLTIVDMEAGLEHLSRSEGTLRHVDLLLVVLEPYRKALVTAFRTQRLARELGIPRVAAVLNKVRDEEERRDLEATAAEWDLPIMGVVPYDDSVRIADRRGQALLDVAPDGPAVAAIAELLDAIDAELSATA